MPKNVRKTEVTSEASGSSLNRLSLRARGIAPRPDYIITPVAGSLIGDISSLRDDREKANRVAELLLSKSGARRSPKTQ